MRGQAEIISTVIIVGVAVALALGVVYYLTPLLAQNRAYSQLQATLTAISASLSSGLVYEEYNSTGGELVAVFSVSHQGGGAPEVALYAGLIQLGSDGVPVAAVNASWYILNSSVASAAGEQGWLSLDAVGGFVVAAPEEVYLFVRDGYYPLRGFSGFENVTGVKLGYLGLLRPGDIGVYKVYAAGLEPGQYVVSLFVLANGVFYEVARIPLEPVG